jgi:hypothetical protein
MLDNLLKLSKIALCIFAGGFLLVLVPVAIHIGQDFDSAAQSIAAAQQDTHAVAAKLNTDLDEFHRLTLEAALTAREVRKTAVQEQAELAGWNTQMTATMGDLDALAISLRRTSDGIAANDAQIGAEAVKTLQTANATIASLQPVAADSGAAVRHLTKATDDLDALIADKNLKQSLANMNTATGYLSMIADDTRQAVHEYLHPKWPKRVWGWVSGAMITAGKIFIP